MTDCLFCRIVKKEIPSKILYEDGEALAFEDVNPQAPVHILIVPCRHIPSLSAAKEEDSECIGRLLSIARRIARERGISEDGYRVVINSGPAGGQTVDHLHLHLLGGRHMGWPPG